MKSIDCWVCALIYFINKSANISLVKYYYLFVCLDVWIQFCYFTGTNKLTSVIIGFIITHELAIHFFILTTVNVSAFFFLQGHRRKNEKEREERARLYFLNRWLRSRVLSGCNWTAIAKCRVVKWARSESSSSRRIGTNLFDGHLAALLRSLCSSCCR